MSQDLNEFVDKEVAKVKRKWTVDTLHAALNGKATEAQARLIAAAPLLMDALEDARERMLGNSPAIKTLRDKTDAALAKARGQS